MEQQEENLKVNEFEKGVDASRLDLRTDTFEFKADSNDHYVYSDMDDLVQNNVHDLEKMLSNFFESQKPRLEILEKYSNGQNYAIGAGRRRVEKEKSDYRIRHNYGGYISSFVTGYVLGKPITITYAGNDGDLDEAEIRNITDNNDLNSLNYELGYDSSRYGRALEYHYRDAQNIDRIELIDPQEMFTVRSISVSRDMIGAVHCPILNGKVYVTAYSDRYIYKFKPFDKSIKFDLILEDVTEHSYGIVPVVEWWNNRYRTGDFENVIPIIDAYDAAQSDTANYMSDLNDAMLVIKTSDIEKLGGKDGIKTMTDANVLVLENDIMPDGRPIQNDANYIYKQYDVTGTESYKERLTKDIFKLSNVPEVTNETFGTQSGIAIQYKLIGLKQIQVTKENYYTKALRRRYQLIENIHQELNEAEVNTNLLTFTFHPNLPEDTWEEIERYISAGGDLSQETLMEHASFTNYEEENERINNELEEQLKMRMTDQELEANGYARY